MKDGGLEFAMSLGQEVNSVTEEEEGNMTSCRLCDGKQLAALSLTRTGFWNGAWILGALYQVRLVLPEFGIGGFSSMQVIRF